MPQNLKTLEHDNTLPQILLLSGSLRESSSTHSIIRVIAKALAEKARVIVYNGIRHLPAFDDRPDPPSAIVDFRNAVSKSQGVFICTPEYAFGVPGALKNAIDWTVTSGEFVSKPVALVTAATGGEKAHASLLLTLSALSANVHPDATLLISFIRAKLNDSGEVKDSATLNSLQKVVETLLQVIRDSLENS